MRTSIVGLMLLAGCVRSVQTGRDQLLLIEEAAEIDLGTQGYQEELSESTLSVALEQTDPVARVGKRLLGVVSKLNYHWEFQVVVDDRRAAAWCLAGGKVAVTTGIFPAAADEAGLAALMAHAVAHALLRHTGERISQTLTREERTRLGSARIGEDSPDIARRIRACGGAEGDPSVPAFVREHEMEADRLGLEIMAKAGYDPRQTLELWKRLDAPGSSSEFLSLHPTWPGRLKDLESRMPSSLALFDQSVKAPPSKLPAPTGAKPAGSPPMPSGQVVASSGMSLRTKTRENRHALLFEFWFNRDVYLQSVRIAGPDGLTLPLDARVGIPANAKKQAYLVRPDIGGADFPAGSYSFTFTGAATGRAFTANSVVEVR